MCNHHSNLVLKHIHSAPPPKKKKSSLLHSVLTLTPSRSPGKTPVRFPSVLVYLFWVLHARRWNHTVQLFVSLSLSTVFERFAHAVEHVSSSFLLPNSVLLCGYMHFISPFTRYWTFGLFLVLPTRDNAAVNRKLAYVPFFLGRVLHLTRYLGADLVSGQIPISLGHFLRNRQTGFQRGCHHFTFPPTNV